MGREHDPGPWKPHFYSSPRGARQSWGVGSEEKGLMGIASTGPGPVDEANARFIAKAPDMEALLAVIDKRGRLNKRMRAEIKGLLAEILGEGGTP